MVNEGPNTGAKVPEFGLDFMMFAGRTRAGPGPSLIFPGSCVPRVLVTGAPNGNWLGVQAFMYDPASGRMERQKWNGEDYVRGRNVKVDPTTVSWGRLRLPSGHHLVGLVELGSDPPDIHVIDDLLVMVSRRLEGN